MCWKGGLISEAEIDRSLERLFVARFRLGMFDPPNRVPWSNIPYSVNDSPEHRALALEAARKSIVLLKNRKHILPLAANVQRIAVIGPSADDPTALLGNYNGFSSKHVTPLDGIQSRFGANRVRFALGATYVSGTSAAAQAIVQSDAFVAPHAGGNSTPAAGHDVVAEYFDNPDLQGDPKLRRQEARPGLPAVPDPALAAAGIPARGFSVRWTGALQAPVSGDYVFAVRGGGNTTRVFVDDSDMLPLNAQGRPAVTSAPLALRSSDTHTLRVEYRSPANANRSGAMQLMWVPPAEALFAEAVRVSKESDITIAFVGLNPNLEGEEMSVNIPGFAGGDRTTLELPAQQERLVRALIATHKPVIVVLTSGSAVAINYAEARAAAVLAAWYGGEEIGTAIAETLAGDNNPAGRLPVTFYKSVVQLPPFEEYAMNGRTYRYFAGEALFGFGYGLSYSSFRYSNAAAARNSDGSTRVTARVKNTSRRAGEEVVQLFIEKGAPAEAIRALAGFERIHLNAGESCEVSFSIPPGVLPAADARVSIGGGQPTGHVPHATVSVKPR